MAALYETAALTDYLNACLIGEIGGGLLGRGVDLAAKVASKFGFKVESGVAKEAAGAAGNGAGEKLVNGVRVIQDDTLINPKLVDDLGRTNAQRMENGLAPIGADGKTINLHHVDQTMTGSVQEMTQTFHQQNYVELHPNTGQSASQIDRSAFGAWRAGYWTTRACDF